MQSSDDPKDAERRKYWDQSLKTYTLLKSNVYLDRKRRVVTEDDIFVCECLKAKPAEALYLEIQNPHLSYNCGERCINRYMCTECDGESCPCGKFCQNRRFQLGQNAKIYPKPTQGKGWGLFAAENIKRGDFIVEYIGEVFAVNSEEGQIRVETYNVWKY